MQNITPKTDHSLREAITKAYRMDETVCLEALISQATLPAQATKRIAHVAKQLVIETREHKKKQGKIDALLHQYDLSTEQGIALMCLAEALLRIPDKATMDKLISDKLSTVEWKDHLSTDHPFFVNAATWSLLLTGKIYAPHPLQQKNFIRVLRHTYSRLGASLIRPIILRMMKAIGKQFVMGQDIHTALKRANALENMPYRFSYDRLGEAARTAHDARDYYASYVSTIDAIGKGAGASHPAKNPGISVKLSALHPRYEYTQYDRVIKELPPLLLALALQAKKYHIGLTVDAEEADRLDLSLDIFEMVYTHPALAGWEGFGLAVQAYQKRASSVIDWLSELAKNHNRRIMVRLVKGAYWDAEIKLNQLQGQSDYPIFTRKNATDVSYLACAKKLLSAPDRFYPQFGTHNAYSVAAILEMAGKNTDFEFQCLYGMGRALYDSIVDPTKWGHACRIYAPVGTHVDLLGYLVRRLLENGANSSFVNRLADENIPLEKLTIDPVARIASLQNKPHPRIPKPRDIYGLWQSAKGMDLSDANQLTALKQQMDAMAKKVWQAGAIVNGQAYLHTSPQAVVSPGHTQEIIGYVSATDESTVDMAITIAKQAERHWGKTDVNERACILERAATYFETEMPNLMAILTREGGKCLLDCLSEVREAIDYCRYYAYRARHDLKPIPLPGPTGETNQLSLHPRGTIACISPWNFPLAIFTGQIVAALATGNTVIAKPAEQTPLIAYKAVNLLHQAGVPKEALQLLIGPGDTIGAKLVSDPRVDGILFTGSTETAKIIEKSLAKRQGPIALFIAETGGQNAMIVDSSALPEQVVIDIAQSAFNSAGQRCSALRVLFVQEEIAPKLLTMLCGYMAELTIGDPRLLSTDIGPVIDDDALQRLNHHFAAMSLKGEGKLIAQVALHQTPVGHYFAPCVFEINDLNILQGEVFGPILHVIRYRAQDLEKVMDAIVQTGYGLTLGIHSRIDATIQYIASRMPVGNLYANRNMIGAIVGVQPFGGERLSGTGPKAGGPYYLPRLCVERCISMNTTAVGGNARLVSLLEEDE